MINQVVAYINSKLTDINENFGLCEKVENDDGIGHIKQLGENGRVIDFAKSSSLSYILPVGALSAEELDSDVGGVYLQRITYPVHLVVFKERCDLPELDVIYQLSQQVVTNNDTELVSTSGALQGAKIRMTEAQHNKKEIFDRDFSDNDFRLKLGQILVSLGLEIELDLDLECDNISKC